VLGLDIDIQNVPVKKTVSFQIYLRR